MAGVNARTASTTAFRSRSPGKPRSFGCNDSNVDDAPTQSFPLSAMARIGTFAFAGHALAVGLLLALLLMSKTACAADAQGFAPEQIREGAELFANNCSPCHGPHMQGSESAFDLRKFPPDQRDRFLSSVTRGKNQMPPWGDAFSPEQLDALWAYVTAGER
jgi:mono/diheme cytochrome c family protein